MNEEDRKKIMRQIENALTDPQVKVDTEYLAAQSFAGDDYYPTGESIIHIRYVNRRTSNPKT